MARSTAQALGPVRSFSYLRRRYAGHRRARYTPQVVAGSRRSRSVAGAGHGRPTFRAAATSPSLSRQEFFLKRNRERLRAEMDAVNVVRLDQIYGSGALHLTGRVGGCSPGLEGASPTGIDPDHHHISENGGCCRCPDNVGFSNHSHPIRTPKGVPLKPIPPILLFLGHLINKPVSSRRHASVYSSLFGMVTSLRTS